MKIDRRTKYGGVRIHLDAKETTEVLEAAQEVSELAKKTYPIKFVSRLGKKITKLLKEVPSLLEEKTEDDVINELLAAKQRMEQQLAAIAAGQDWKQV